MNGIKEKKYVGPYNKQRRGDMYCAYNPITKEILRAREACTLQRLVRAVCVALSAADAASCSWIVAGKYHYSAWGMETIGHHIHMGDDWLREPISSWSFKWCH